MMRAIRILQPPLVVVGEGAHNECISYAKSRNFQRVHILSTVALQTEIKNMCATLEKSGCAVSLDIPARGEPTIEIFEHSLKIAREHKPDCIIGIGGGSVLDLAKLVAVFVNSNQDVRDCFGIGLVKQRACHLICLPSTSGTGSEVSPNAILLDTSEHLKKGVISEYLVPDATFIDPSFTLRLPADVTAFTGLDALTHCVEAYTNKFAHPVIDVYALEGIRLTAKYLVRAVQNGADLEAREGMCLASMFGGMCLGPVNTAAVHALAYPLGGEYHIAHGLSNAILLPTVFRFNGEAAPLRHAQVAIALGCPEANTTYETALRGAEKLHELVLECGIDPKLATYGVSKDRIAEMAKSAAKVTRLLKNNPRNMDVQDIECIYESFFEDSAGESEA